MLHAQYNMKENENQGQPRRTESILAKGIKTIPGRTRQGDGVTTTIGKLCYDCCINPCGFCNGL